MQRLAVGLVLAVGCYKPAPEQACATLCSAHDQRCPENMTCGGDLRCHVSGENDCSDAAVDRCYGTGLSGFGEICDPVDVPPSITLSSDVFTDSDTRCIVHRQSDDSEVCVMIAGDIVVDSNVHVSGTRPLALIGVVHLTVTANGWLDAGTRTASSQAGAGFRDCSTPTGTDNVSGGGGGAGGANQGNGGAGGSGDRGLANGAPASPPEGVPTTLRGGCNGGRGGYTTMTATNGGVGGGALYLIAGQVLEIAGPVNAGGGGAPTGVPHQGGGGGGAGGMIVLEAPSLIVTSTVTAHGGGGGGGLGDTITATATSALGVTYMDGAPGSQGTTAAGGAVAGGTGGRGSTASMLSGTTGGSAVGTVDGAAGAGGGGGAGWIFASAGTRDDASGVISPPAP